VKEIKCLDNGFVRLVDSMGDDTRVVNSARVSYAAIAKDDERDARLISYLMRNGHTSPFEQVVMTFHLKIPLFVFAQLVRHRTARLNAQSARYTIMMDEFYLPSPDKVRGQGEGNKQVGDGVLEERFAADASTLFRRQARAAYGIYTDLIELGVCREQARMVLPQNLYTQCYWQMDLHNLLKFIGLRDHPHAQAEMQEYARAMLEIAREMAPVSVAAWEATR
jgi:thymidylate synthase (FAD)